MGRKLKYDIPGPDCRRSPEDFRTRGGEALFAPDLVPPFRLVVEIGFGRGEFIAGLAECDPETAFLGIEVSFKRVLKLARRVAASTTRNLRLVHAVAEEVVYDSLPPGSVDEFWINFPDPWPRDSQAKHRLVQGGFVTTLATRLRPGGLLRVATDDRAYADQIDGVLCAERLLENVHAPAPWRSEVEGRLRTAYEEEWRSEGRPLHFFEYRRIPGD